MVEAQPVSLPGATWSRKRGCVELAEADVIALHLVVERLREAGVRVRFKGRLRHWDGVSPVWRMLVRESAKPPFKITRTRSTFIWSLPVATPNLSGTVAVDPSKLLYHPPLRVCILLYVSLCRPKVGVSG